MKSFKRTLALTLALVTLLALAAPAAMAAPTDPYKFSDPPSRAIYYKSSAIMKGNDVKWVQAALNIIMNAGLTVDGSAGPATDKAIRNFQKKYGLAVDGSFGPASRQKAVELLNKKGYPLKTTTRDLYIDTTVLQLKVDGSTWVRVRFSGLGIDSISYSLSGNGITASTITESDWSGSGKGGCSVVIKITTDKNWKGNGTLTFQLKNNSLGVIKKADIKLIAPSGSGSTNKVFEEKLVSLAKNENGETNGRKYGGSTEWCGYYAKWLLTKAYKDAKLNVPTYLSGITGANSCANIFAKGTDSIKLHVFKSWKWDEYSQNKTANFSSYKPKVGDLILTETNGAFSDGPDHVAVIIKVNSDGSFVTSEGNSGDNYGVNQFTYKFNSKLGTWQKDGAERNSIYYGTVWAICSAK